ncbi:hypothetical protein I6M49_04365 [Shewanella algae]|uniref:hypothetical protein n=1 Tax=Shewanella algae TaxID=38313 RepID=UPI001AACC858|nr:hypothetical protein [Shewanella algae]MBO2652707.1 hypothetical protein [Shewanella algae]
MTNQNNKPQNTSAASNGSFSQLYKLLHDQGLKYVQDGKPESEPGTSYRSYCQQSNVLAFERKMKLAHTNMIAIGRLSRMKPDANAAARLVFSNLPSSGQELIHKLSEVDFSSSRRFLTSLGRAGKTSDNGIWDFPDLRCSEKPDSKATSGFMNYCASLYPLNGTERRMTESLQDYRVKATLNSTHETMKRLGLPGSLEQVADYQKTKERECKNLRLACVMDDFKHSLKNRLFGKNLCLAADTALIDGFDAAAEQLWQDFARNEQSAIFGNLPRLALLVRALQAVQVATTNEFSRASLLDRAPALLRAFSQPSLSRSLVSMVTSQFDALNVPDAQGVLDRLEIALATTPAGGAHAESLVIALPLLMAGEAESLAESGDQDPADIEQEILEGIRFDIGQLIALDLE